MTTMLPAYLVIFLWAVWCVFSVKVRDGIVGKLFYSAVAIAALAAVVGNQWAVHDRSDFVLISCFALMGIRHFVLKYLKDRKAKQCQRQP